MPDPRILTAAEAIREATEICLERDPRVFVIGEGVADPKAIFGTTAGLLERFGAERVMEMPVAENGLTGVVIGAALTGLRPILIHQRVDFALLAVEQMFNNAAKTLYVTNGQHRVPLVIRMIIGRGWGQGPAHSQGLEAMFSMVPGLKVVMPTSAHESKGMLIAAVEDDNPVLMLEHRWSHYVRGDVPAGHYTVPLQGPNRVAEGDDITIVATSYMLYEARRAAETLRKAGVGVDLFDLRVLRPLDLAPIIASVRRTGRLLTCDTGPRLLGMGAEIVSTVTEHAFSSMRAAPARLGLPDRPTPSSHALAETYYPDSLDVIDAACRMLDVPAERIRPHREALAAELAKLPVDIPDPAFRGPF